MAQASGEPLFSGLPAPFAAEELDFQPQSLFVSRFTQVYTTFTAENIAASQATIVP